MKKVCIVTVSRADYGLLRWVAQEVSRSDSLELRLVTAGTHDSQEYGNTVREIEDDGFTVDFSIPIIPVETNPRHILQALGNALPQFADAFDIVEPDIIVLLGDRSETLLAAFAATIYGIPIAHIHGGELTAGAIDDALRHAITKMAHLHFVAHDTYRRRVVQMGENLERVVFSGSLGQESTKRLELLPQDTVEKSLGVPLSENAFLVTIHPETLHPEKNRELVTETLGALEQLENVLLIFTAANQDAGGSKINAALQDFCSAHSHARFFESLGTELYLSVMAHSRAVLGNSSSGIFEAPALGIPTINIGSRQDGRIREVSVADVAASKEAILDALRKAMSRGTGELDNPRDNSSLSPLPSQIITQVLEKSDFGKLRDKGFVDITDIGLTL